MKSVVCFGEVLWDVFPDRKNIGGAPLNVALRLNSFGTEVKIISRVGNDINGKNALNYIKSNGLEIEAIQIDEVFDTGVVDVTLDEKGSASYEIKHPVAWDKIELTDKAVKDVKKSDAFIYGSLACRDDISRKTLFHLLDVAFYKVFDVNLRPPHYSFSLLDQLMQKADLIKLNDEEIIEICKYYNFKGTDITKMIKFLSEETKTKTICVTKGADGALLFINNNFYDHKGYKIEVKDTVGAGDSFLASLIYKLLSSAKPQHSLAFACATGSLVASKEGANPELSTSEIENFIQKVNL